MAITRLLIAIVAGYAAVVVIAFFLQRRLLYFPDPPPPLPSRMETLGLAFWPDADDSFRGYISNTPKGEIKGTVIVFHGNGGSAWHREYYARMLPRVGYRVLLAEYPVYGGRPGNLNEKQIVADALETMGRIQREFGGPIYLCGESLGAGVAAATAAASPDPPAGVIAITPWDTLPDLAQSFYWYLPVRLLLQDTYDNVGNLNRYGGPVVVTMAEHDEIIPQKHTLRLYKSLDTPKKLLTFPGATHNNWTATADSVWWRDTMDFFENKLQTEIPHTSQPEP